MTAFSTVFLAYHGDVLCAMVPLLRLKSSPPQARLEPGSARSVAQCQ